jgi:hypothetical protein
LLETEFQEGKTTFLNTLFAEIAEKSKHITDSEYNGLMKFEKCVYDIFEDFYNPLNLEKYGDFIYGNSLYEKSQYLVVQNSIEVRIVDFNLDTLDYLIVNKIETKKQFLSNLKILNFRPRINSNVKILYKNSIFNFYFIPFFTNDFVLFADGDIMSPAKAIGLALEKQKYIDKYFRIMPKHWRDGWHLTTHPFVEKVYLNKTYDRALVFFRIVNEGGYSLYIKSAEKWKQLDS